MRKKCMNESGVSEVFGDLLILTITVSLFVGVFAMVWNFPAPDSGAHADFVTAVDLKPFMATINVTHAGGESLRADDTAIYLYKNDEDVKILKIQGKDLENPTYGIPGDGNWDPGETWTYNYSVITSNDNLRISILDTRNNKLIMKGNLLFAGVNSPPVIMDRWYAPAPSVNGSTVTIAASVMDYNGRYDVETVEFNGSVLNSAMGTVDMEDPDGDGIYKTRVTVTEGPGEYEIVIVARDVPGASDRGRLCMRIVPAEKPVIETVVVNPNSLETSKDFSLRCVVTDGNGDLNFSEVTVTPGSGFYENGGSIVTEFITEDTIPTGGVFKVQGLAPWAPGEYGLTVEAKDEEGLASTKEVTLSVIMDESGGNGSYNDTIWNFIGPESLDFRSFYYTTDNPPVDSTEYHLAVYIDEEHIGSDCYFHINIINHYYEDVYIDGNSRMRLLQIGGAASNKDIEVVRNGSYFGDPVGTVPDGTWYRIPAPDDGDYFHGGEPQSLVFGPFDLQSAKAGDVFGTILVLTGSFCGESTETSARYGQTLPFQAVLIS